MIDRVKQRQRTIKFQIRILKERIAKIEKYQQRAADKKAQYQEDIHALNRELRRTEQKEYYA